MTREFARMSFYRPRVHLAPPDQWDASVKRMHVLPDPPEPIFDNRNHVWLRTFGRETKETP